MKTFIFLAFAMNFQFARAADLKNVSKEMSVMTRTVDALMARQEMKQSLSGQAIKAVALQNYSGDPEVSKKVAMLTNPDSLDSCKITFKEDKSADGQTDDSTIQYTGADCPLLLTAVSHIQATQVGAMGDVLMQIEIVSPKLKAEIDMTKFSMPMKINVTAEQNTAGMAINMDMAIGGNMTSQKYGQVDFSADMKTQIIFGQAMELNQDNTEIYNNAGQKTKFEQKASSKDNSQTYLINDQVVKKDEFDKQHAEISLPGYEDKNTPLAVKQTCDIKTYDSAQFNLETVRAHIKDHTIDSLKVAEVLASITLVQTGKTQLPVMISRQNIMLEVATTPDAARFSFEKDLNSKQSLAKMTAVLGEDVDLTQNVLDRVVRITCHVQK